MSEPRIPADFAEVLADPIAPLIVGGQAVNLWAEVYVGRCPELDTFSPFTSQDADIFGTRELAEELARKAGWACKFIHDSNAVTVAVLTKSPDNQKPLMVIEVLGEVNGLNASDLALDTIIEVAEGQRYRVPSPLVLLKAKLYNLVSLANLDRPQDIRHTRMLLRLMPLYLMDLATEQKAGRLPEPQLAAAIHYASDVISQSYAGNAARAYGLDLADIFSPEVHEIVPSDLGKLIGEIQKNVRQIRRA